MLKHQHVETAHVKVILSQVIYFGFWLRETDIEWAEMNYFHSVNKNYEFLSYVQVKMQRSAERLKAEIDPYSTSIHFLHFRQTWK